jgi:hypothetical protein
MVKSSTTPKSPSLLAPPDVLASPPTVETVQGNLADGHKVSTEPELEAGRAYASSAIPIAERGLLVRKAWLAAPVIPRPDVGEDFPPYANIPSLLKVAAAQIVSDPAIPTTLSEPFVRNRGIVTGYAEEIPRAEAALAAIPKLTLQDCTRHPQLRGTSRWPENGRVGRLHADLTRMGTGRDRLDDYARALAQCLETVLRWSRGQKALGIRQAAVAVTPRRDDAEPTRAITEFNVFDNR